MLSISSPIILLSTLIPLTLANGHFSVRLRLSSLSPSPVRTILSIGGTERSLTVTGTEYVDIDYQLPREHLIEDKTHILTIIAAAAEVSKESIEIRRFSRSAHIVKGALRVISEAVECEKDYYGPFCWVQCLVAQGEGKFCDSEGIPRCRKPGCDVPKTTETPVNAPVAALLTQQQCQCRNGGICLPVYSEVAVPVCQCPSGFGGSRCEAPVEESNNGNVLLVVYVILFLLVGIAIGFAISLRLEKNEKQESKQQPHQIGHISISMPEGESSESIAQLTEELSISSVDQSTEMKENQDVEERRDSAISLQDSEHSLDTCQDNQEIDEIV